jgi:hypothetical protein
MLLVMIALLLFIAVMSHQRFRIANRLCPSSSNSRFRPSASVFGIFQYEPGDREILISPLVSGVEVEDCDGDMVPCEPQHFLDSNVSNLHFRNGPDFEVLLESVDSSGQPLWARITKAKRFIRSRFYWRWCFRTAAASMAFSSIVWFFFSRPVVASLVQYFLDYTRLT